MDELVISAQSKPDTLIFLFHGYGSNKDNMEPIGNRFAETLPTAEIHIANGVEHCEEVDGYKWFSMNTNSLEDWNLSFEQNATKIVDYIESTMKSKNLTYQDVILSGFSQGAMLSISLGVYHNVKAVIAFSGLILYPERYLRHANTKVLLTHGSDDSVIPAESLEFTKFALERCGIDTKKAIALGLDHAINQYLLNEAVDFLRSL